MSKGATIYAGGSAPRFLPRGQFASLLEQIAMGGYLLLGPTVRDGAIVYGEITDEQDLPLGVHDRQAPGTYRLEAGHGPRWFAWANGPQALKPRLFSPREALWDARRDADGRLAISEVVPDSRAVAVLGVRACDLAALRLQDQHFLEGNYVDARYQARRERLLLIAVHCSHPADTCFCASTGDGPGAQAGFDLALGELDEGFVVEVGSAAGAALVQPLNLAPATADQCEAVRQQTHEAAVAQRRTLPSRDLRAPLFAALEHPRWNDVAQRCLSCGNCTSVCPTCFCHAEVEEPALDGHASTHYRQWDSCFTPGHSYIHGIVIRADTRLRYRQWLTHKLGSWHDQYGRSGCVGCGRCITWCPTGIDITEEATALCGAGDEHG